MKSRQGLFQNLLANKLNYFSQNNVHYAMLAKRYVDTNQLTIEANDPKSGTAEFKASAVRIERV